MKRIKFEIIDQMGIMDGDTKRLLEDFDEEFKKCFKQRKSYDEYYIITDSIVIDMNLEKFFQLSSIDGVSIVFNNNLLIIKLD